MGGEQKDPTQRIHAAIPAQFNLGVAILNAEDAHHLGAIEASWDRIIVDANRDVKLMKRPWYILTTHMHAIQGCDGRLSLITE